MWKVTILTLFPELYPGILSSSIIGNALSKDIWSLHAYNIRDYAHDKHQTVDDVVYGGGDGMLLRPDILGRAIEDKMLHNGFPIIYLTPRAPLFTQSKAYDFIQKGGINIICGRFEGIDERVMEEYNIIPVSMGDYVVSSGDVLCYPFIDACVRLLPAVLGNHNSLHEESFGAGEYARLLEYPHYTRPYLWKGRKVPDILLSGHHKNIAAWRLKEAHKTTQIMRPDLLKD